MYPAYESGLTLRNTLKAKTGSCRQGKASCSDNQLQAASTAAPQLFGPPLEARRRRRAGGCNETKKHTSWCMCFLGICIVKLRQLAASSSFATFTQPQVIYALIVFVSPATSAPPPSSNATCLPQLALNMCAADSVCLLKWSSRSVVPCPRKWAYSKKHTESKDRQLPTRKGELQ